MGLEEKADAGLDIEDLVNIYKGHIKDRYQVSYLANYLHIHVIDLVLRLCACFIEWLITNESASASFVLQFSPSTPLAADAPGYKQKVTLNDKIHCVVYVIDTCKVSLLTQKMLDKFAAIRKKTNQLG